MKPTPCGSCRASVIWGLTEKGKRMPVDAEPVLGGNLAFSNTTADVPTIVVVGKRTDPNGNPELGRVSHFVTCPNAQKHRKSR